MFCRYNVFILKYNNFLHGIFNTTALYTLEVCKYEEDGNELILNTSE